MTAVVVIGIVGTAGALGPLRGDSSSPAVTVATTAPAPATSPTPASVEAYLDVVTFNSSRMSEHFDGYSRAMKLNDTRRMISEMQGVLEDAGLFRAALDRTPPPLVLAAADVDLRAALDDYTAAAHLLIAGLDLNESDLLESGYSTLEQANRHLSDATDHILAVAGTAEG